MFIPFYGLSFHFHDGINYSMKIKVAQSHLTLCDPMDLQPLDSLD